MKNTRLMEFLFSNEDEEIAMQVDNDIRTAEDEGVVDTDELTYENTGDGVAITDKGTGQVTLAQRSNEADTYDLIAVPDEHLEKYLHPSANGFTPGNQVGGYVERASDHMTPELLDSMGLYPEDQYDYTVEENAEDQREFSIYSDNDAFQKVFSRPQETMEGLFTEVIESEETITIGDLKIEKSADDDNSVVVTSLKTGDQAKVTLTDGEMEVQELDSKNFSDSYLPLYIIGVQPYDHILVEAQAYTQEAAEELVNRLTEDGIEACNVFEDPEAARDYAFGLLENLGASPAEGKVEEPELQRQYSDGAIYTADYRTDDTVFMSRMFSEQNLGITDTRDAVEQALRAGEEIEIDGAVITPIEATKAIIDDNGQHTLATIQGEDTIIEPLDSEEAIDYLNDGEINSLYYDSEDDEEREFSGIYTDEYETKFFSEYEDLTSYMERIFSEESDQNIIEEAILNGQEIENDSEIVTPISNNVAIVEDKEDGDFTKAVIIDEDRINLHPISHNEADNLLANVEVDTEDEEVEHEYSDIYTDEYETKFFSALEPMNDYMVRLFSDEADHEHIKDALDDQKQVETDDEIITPVSDDTTVIEDKKDGGYSKAVYDEEEDQIEVTPIDEDEAEDLMKDVEVDDDEDEEEVEHEYSDVYTDAYETRFFSALEPMTGYMERIFTEEADQEHIEEALEDQKQVETDDEIITPVSDDTVVIEDKKNGEYTKAVVGDEDEDDDDKIELTPIDEDEADDLMEDVEVDDDEEEEEVEHEYSDVYTDAYETRFFSALEPMTDYMVRLFSEEADQEHIEEALEDQQQIETDDEIITPVSEDTAVIKDKKNGEYSKAVVGDEDDDEEDQIEVTPIDEDEAEDLMEDVEVEEEKKYSSLLDKFFAEAVMAPQQMLPQGQLPVDPAQGQIPVEQQGQYQYQYEMPAEQQQQGGATVENVEDKAELAVQSIRAAAEEAAQMIMEAKAAPAPTEDPEIQEAQFSERTFCQSGDDTLISWLRNN